MTSYQIFHDNIANEEYLHNTIKVALEEIYDLLKECYGPYGSSIMITKDNPYRIEPTKDGRDILESISMGASISAAVQKSLTSVAQKQVAEVGDGSTTTILLLCKLYNKFRDIITKNNLSPAVFQKKLHKVIDAIKNKIEASARIISGYDEETGKYEIDRDMLYNAIYTSVDADKELADVICNMFMEINAPEPLILLDSADGVGHHYELVKGVETEGSIIDSRVYFDGYSRREYKDCRIVVINGRLNIKSDQYLDIVQACTRDEVNIIFLCSGISETLETGIMTQNNAFPGACFRCPIFQIRKTALDDEFLDMCAMLGATYIDSETTNKWMTSQIAMQSIMKASGHCPKALLTEFCARFNDPKSNDDAVAQRIASIDEKLDMIRVDPTSVNATIADLEARKSYLSRNYAKFYVGGKSPQRKAINMALADDGIKQASSCLKHGVVNGSNTSILKYISICIYSYRMSDEYTGDNDITESIYLAIYEAYTELTIQLIANKTGSIDKAREIFNDYLETTRGEMPLNLRDNDETPENYIVINSADTDRAILEYSSDMATLLATTKGFIGLFGRNEFDIINKPAAQVLDL